MSDVSQLLRRYGTQTSNANYSHELLYTPGLCSDGSSAPGMRYHIKNENLGELLAAYCKSYAEDAPDLCLAEKPSEIMPVMIRLNLAFDATTYFEPYSENFLYHFTRAIQQVIVQDLEVHENSNDQLTCIVIEGEEVTSKDGQFTLVDVRFQFPNCRCDVEVQTKTLLPHLIRALRALGMNSKFHIEPVGGWEKLIDHDFYSRAIPLLGSRADIYSPVPPKFNSGCTVLPSLLHEDLDAKDYEPPDISLEQAVNWKEHEYVKTGLMSRSHFEQNPDADFWLPLYLSTRYGTKVVLPRRKYHNSPGTTFDHDHRYDLSNFGRGGDLEELNKLDLAPIFLKLWKPERFLNEEYWRLAGEALYDADDGNEAGLQLWIDFTEKAIEYLEVKVPEFMGEDIRESCNSQYTTFRLDRITVHTLAYIAKDDNPAEYNKWHQPWCRRALEVAVSGLDTDVARAFFRFYWLEGFCVYQGKRVIWYIFNRDHLQENPNGYVLTKIMSGEFYRKVLDMMEDVIREMKCDNDGKAQEHARKILANINKLLCLLRTHHKKSTFLKEATESFVRDNLEQLLDENPDLLGLPNGVLVATTNRCYIRRGRPEDYITRTTRVPYRRDLGWEHPLVKEGLLWINQTFPYPELAHQFRKINASLLRGRNSAKKFYTFTGGGDNSKSMWTKAYECIFGSYCIKLPIGIATNNRGDAQGPSPATARAKGTRICILEEADEDVPLKANVIKYLTGSDTYFARMLKKNGNEITPLFKLFLMTNKIPRFQGGDKAMGNRMSIMPCEATWADDAPDDPAQQMADRRFKLNPYFEDRIPILAAALFWIMVEDYELFVREGVRNEPDIVKKRTQEYWEEHDLYYQFTSEAMENVYGPDGKPDPSVQTSVDEVYNRFKEWHEDTFPGLRKIPFRPTVRTELSRRWRPPVMGYWPGVRFKRQAVDLSGGSIYSVD